MTVGIQPSKLIDGKAVANTLTTQIAADVAALRSATGKVPGLAVILVGEDPASAVYVAYKHRQTLAVGMASFEHKLPADTNQDDLLSIVNELNQDPSVHGILVQLPLPSQIDPNMVLNAIDPTKDVDGFHVQNAGRLATGQEGFVPCTPRGCLLLLKHRLGDLAGLHAIIVGRSNIVGKPMAQLLLAENCTVTVAHSRTRELPALCRMADILVAAVGRAEMIRGDWIKPGAVVVDIGVNRVTQGGKPRLVGDVAFAEAAHVQAITPVPGGVGPMTIACLLANTLSAFRHTLAARNN
ncbi:bifunctional methylenetetrahydrofolate dehydrogenase/methenyltetrahydrofolate cyclohydrolase FolD [Mesorhizobium sp. M0106]|uniref:bifunctional methylenetetrahydrofolate dehydrogenase/methenyltetrahydrofolate cyclohydrolase FolD n=1 Tax=Mesorhizobium sp. M0106 TaxID=2956880 RepID=UPI00333D1539